MLRPMLRSAFLSGVCLMMALAPAFGQGRTRTPPRLTDLQLVVKLHELARAKGDYDKRLGPGFCRRLGVRPIGLCEAFVVQFAEGDRPAATFYSLDDGRNGMVRIFITSNLEPSYVDDYRVDAEGRLERAVRRRGETSSHLAVKDAGQGFHRVMDFLRAKPDELADWPDATIVDDGSCPKGQVKRVPRQPSHAVCLDRKRLKML
jgi:hypothetical protein